jgi:hypothetical protein
MLVLVPAVRNGITVHAVTLSTNSTLYSTHWLEPLQPVNFVLALYLLPGVICKDTTLDRPLGLYVVQYAVALHAGEMITSV